MVDWIVLSDERKGERHRKTQYKFREIFIESYESRFGTKWITVTAPRILATIRMPGPLEDNLALNLNIIIDEKTMDDAVNDIRDMYSVVKFCSEHFDEI